MSAVLPPDIPLILENGEKADQKTFHAWYETAPETLKAELIGGEVVVSSPAKARHGDHTLLANTWLGFYMIETPGTRGRDNTTIILDDDTELQPDSALAIEPECGGQTSINEEGYVVGAPEFVGEVANSSGSIDLHRKKNDFERMGVREYLVVLLRNQQVRWFSRVGKIFQDTAPGPDGIYRSSVFPGLWLDPQALLRLDGKGLLETLQKGLASEEHRQFVEDLAKRRVKKP